MVVELAHVAPPGCVSVGGAIPVGNQYRTSQPTALGQAVLTRACWGAVGVSMLSEYD